MTVLEQLKRQNNWTYRALAEKCGIAISNVFAHCVGRRAISAEMAIRYHLALGVPLKDLRPDLWGAEGKMEIESREGA